jgi:hypothetical protein
MNELEEWIASRPKEIQELYKKYPIGTTFLLEGKKLFLVGYQETTDRPGFLVSETDPYEDYEKAISTNFYLCGDCVDD